MIHIENLVKSFGKLTVLKNVSLDFPAGEVVALIGPNGSGKTTLIKSILGLVVPDGGTLTLDGQNILQGWEYRSQIGYMPQIGRYPEQMKIRQVFEMMKDLRSSVKSLDEELIADFGLQGMMEKRMGTLSGGTRQKVSAALAFMFQPKLYILDEPTAGLDPVASEHLKNKILKQKKQGSLTLVTSHNMSEVEELADRVVFLVDGVVKFNLTISELLEGAGESKLGKALAKRMEGEVYA
jgi:Cu-processing system ATP-binding protein